MRRRRGSLLLSAFLTLAQLWGAADGLRVGFHARSRKQLHALQDFEATGGFVNVSISVAPGCGASNVSTFTRSIVSSAAGATEACSYAALDFLFVGVFSEMQWQNLSQQIEQGRASSPSAAASGQPLPSSAVALDCAQPAVARTALSLLSWREGRAALEADGAAAGVAPNLAALGLGGGPTSSAELGSLPAIPPLDAGLHFSMEYALPWRSDVYTLGLFNCFGEDVDVRGEATFVGGNGETLSPRQLAILTVRSTILGVTALGALGLALLIWVYRATAVPLHWLLFAVLLMRALQQAFLLIPLLAAMTDELSPNGGALTSARSTIDASSSSSASASSSASSSSGTTSSSSSSSVASFYDTDEWGLQRGCVLASETASHIAALLFFTSLLALAAGRHFMSSAIPTRERDSLIAAYCLFVIFGMLQSACMGEVACGIFVLSFHVIRILLVFGVLLFLNASVERLRRATGNEWRQLRIDLLRLTALRAMRLQLLLIYLILPIIFMFLEVVLDWRATWFKLLWREGLELYIVFALIYRLLPTPSTYSVHFRHLRPAATANLSPGYYPGAFRYLLGSRLDYSRADAALAAHAHAQVRASGAAPRQTAAAARAARRAARGRND